MLIRNQQVPFTIYEGTDNNGITITSKVHYGYPAKIATAFWDRNSMVFGDGNGESTREFSYGLDIVAHVSVNIFVNIVTD